MWLDELIDPAPRTMRGRCLPYGDGITVLAIGGDPEVDGLGARHRPAQPSTGEDREGQRRRPHRRRHLRSGTNDGRPRVHRGRRGPGVPIRRHGSTRRQGRDPRRLAIVLLRPRGRGAYVRTIEDIHWADAAFLDLLDELAEGVTGSVVFRCPARPELTSRRPGWGGGRRNFSSISLNPLDLDEAEHRPGRRSRSTTSRTLFARKFLERGEGNPFFLEE